MEFLSCNFSLTPVYGSLHVEATTKEIAAVGANGDPNLSY